MVSINRSEAFHDILCPTGLGAYPPYSVARIAYPIDAH